MTVHKMTLVKFMTRNRLRASLEHDARFPLAKAVG